MSPIFKLEGKKSFTVCYFSQGKKDLIESNLYWCVVFNYNTDFIEEKLKSYELSPQQLVSIIQYGLFKHASIVSSIQYGLFSRLVQNSDSLPLPPFQTTGMTILLLQDQ